LWGERLRLCNIRILVRLESLEERLGADADAGVCADGTLPEAPQELPVLAEVPPFTLNDLAGEPVALDDFRAKARATRQLESDLRVLRDDRAGSGEATRNAWEAEHRARAARFG
jgi:hypothetical protein